MANVYVRSGAAGAGTGADWTNAYTTLAAALTAKAAGDSFWVSEDHAETQASAMTLTSPATLALPCFVYCVNHAGSVPPVSADLRTTATISTTGASAIAFTSAGSGGIYFYGIIFQSGSAASAASIRLVDGGNMYLSMESCGLTLGNTNANSKITLGNGGNSNKIILKNCTYTFGGQLSQGFSAGVVDSNVYIRGGAVVVGATVPTTLFQTTPPIFLIEGLDCSALTSGKTLFGASTGATGLSMLKDCKLGSGVTIAAAPTIIGQRIILSRSDSSGTNYRSEVYDYPGTETVETTIVRTGGASDGTTSIAKKIVTTANSKWLLPFESLPIAIWNDTVGSSITVMVYGIWGGGAVPNNDDIWMDVEYLGASGNPLAFFATTTKADNLASGSALASDSSTWGGSTTKFKMSVTFTPQQKGTIYVYVKAALASSTFYIDPEVVVS